jgi:hypothetical protein
MICLHGPHGGVRVVVLMVKDLAKVFTRQAKFLKCHGGTRGK